LQKSVDLDYEIETRERKSIKEIFSLNGEDYFRQIESKTLIDWSASSKSFVMATGGGTPCFYKGIEVINETGLSIFLDVPVTQLLARLEKKTDRPLLSASDKQEMEEKLSVLRSRRLAVYQQAHITVENPDLSKLMEAIHLRK
jgi:shikimate kinase